MKTEARREVMPDDFALNVTKPISEIPDDDPNYVYKWFGKDDPEGIATARDDQEKNGGYRISRNTARRVRMGIPKAVADARQKAIWDTSRALLEQRPDDEPEGAPDPANEGRKVQNTHSVAKATIAQKFSEDSGE